MEYRYSKNSDININNHVTANVGLYLSDINLRSLSEKKSKPNPRPNSTSTSFEVEVVDASNFQKAARTLQLAFANDEFTSYLTKSIESPELRKQVDLALFEASVFSSILDGIVVAIRDVELELKDANAPFCAVACFTKPNMDSGFWDRVYMGNFRRELVVSETCSRRVFMEQFPILDKTKSEILQEDETYCWYLADIGTIPSARGKGCAKALLNHVYENYIDRDQNAICYLESTNVANRSVYENLGFRFIKKLKVGHVSCAFACGDGCQESPLEMDIMVRGVHGQEWTRKDPISDEM